MSENKYSQSPDNQLAKTCMVIFAIGGFAGYQVIAPSLFGNPAVTGFSHFRSIGAGVVVGLCGLAGYGIGKLIQKIKR
jgi:hypothetical protein